ncbi:hypothetical protein OSB04_027790 [Centaurea solstitialis]|uniref:CCHC-type domain-containing protein n=1 Tax=Centaurea solstitialis TaxID=347529 RepID=A0AA38SG03_9ASTR|nr:hypothetical protein OSB04_027790 [Centaurea solstitialis]
MASSSNTNFMSIGSQSKPPTLCRKEFQQWKIRMVNFLEGIHPRITEFLHNPPFIPVKLIPRVPATPTTDENPEYYSPKPRKDWDENETKLVDLATKCKRLLIMAIPNDIFESLDHCENSMNLWKELQKQLEGGVKAQKNNRTMCINEYHEFRAKDGESLKDTYSRLNVLINKCRRSGVIRSDEDNNMLFLKSLGLEWLHLTMSMRTTMDLEFTSLADLFGSLASQEPLVMQMKNSIGGPLALMAEEGKKKEKDEKPDEKKKKKKSVTVENNEEFNSSEDEVSAQEMMKVLALLTKEYKKGFGNRGRGRESSYRRDDYRRDDYRREDHRRDNFRKGEEIFERKDDYERRDVDRKRWNEREDQRSRSEDTRINPQKNAEGCFRCGKLDHYAADCWSNRPLTPQLATTS